MTREEREELAQRICNFYIDAANKSSKTTVDYFMKQGIPRQTIYNILNKYLKYGETKFLPRSGRPFKLSKRQINQLVKYVNNRCGVSQRKLAKRFHVHQSTISRNLRTRTSIVIRKRRKVPKMNNKAQEKRSRKNCGKLYKMIPRNCDIILDDEKFFTLSNANVGGNAYFYSTDPSTAPIDIKFKKKMKFEPKIMVWMAMSSKGISDVYIHRSNEAMRQDVYLNECIIKRLLPFVQNYHQNDEFIFWPDLARVHYSKIVQARLVDEKIPCVSYQNNPPNVPQVRPIETVWALLAQKVYENNWEAKTLDVLASRIKQKVRELDKTTLQAMVQDVRKIFVTCGAMDYILLLNKNILFFLSMFFFLIQNEIFFLPH